MASDVFLDWTTEKHRFRSWKMWIWDHMRTEEKRYLVAPLQEETPLPVFATLRFVEHGGIPPNMSKREIQRPILGRSLTSWLAMGSGASVAAAGGVNWCHIWFLLTVFWVKGSETRPKMACLMISGISDIYHFQESYSFFKTAEGGNAIASYLGRVSVEIHVNGFDWW